MKFIINVHFPHEFYNPGDIASIVRNIAILYGKCNYELNFYNCQYKENKIFKYIIKKCGRTNAENSEQLKKFFDVNIIETINVYGGDQKVIFSKCGEIIYLHIVNDNFDYIFDILHFFCQKRNIIKNNIKNTSTTIYIDNIQYYPNLAFVKKIALLYPNVLFKIKLSSEEFTMKQSQENRIKNIYELFENVFNVKSVNDLCFELINDSKQKYYLVDLDDNAISCETVKTENNIGLIFGSESHGISKQVYDVIYKLNNYQKIFIESKSSVQSVDNFTCSSMNLAVAVFSTLSMMFV